MDERNVIEAAAKGNEAAFETIVRRHEKTVYNICLRMTGDPDEAFDLSQETFIKAWHALALFKFESKFSTWLGRIAANTCMDHLRKQKRKNTVSLTVLDDEDTPVERLIVDNSTDPAILAEKAEDQEAVKRAFMALSAQDRMILSLRAVDDMSYQEIGDALNLKPGTVKSRIARARERVRQNLNGNLSSISASKDRKGGVRQ